MLNNSASTCLLREFFVTGDWVWLSASSSTPCEDVPTTSPTTKTQTLLLRNASCHEDTDFDSVSTPHPGSPSGTLLGTLPGTSQGSRLSSSSSSSSAQARPWRVLTCIYPECVYLTIAKECDTNVRWLDAVLEKLRNCTQSRVLSSKEKKPRYKRFRVIDWYCDNYFTSIFPGILRSCDR